MHKPLSLGFIGGGINSAIGQTHKIASQMDGHFKLVAGCFSRDEVINLQTGQQWGLEPEKIYHDAMELLEQCHNELDALVILTPTPVHREIILACLEYRLPVICEKALVATVEEAQEIADEVERLAGKLFVTYNYSGYPMIRELRERLLSGELGKIQQVMVEMPQEGFARLRADGSAATPQSWRCSDGPIPTVSLDLGVHVHHMVEFLTNKQALDVYAVNSTFARIPGVVDTVHIVSRYTDDLVCNYWYGKAAMGYRNGLRIRVYGSEGSAEWVQMDPEVLRMSDSAGRISLVDRTSGENRVAHHDRYCRFKAGHPAGFIEAFANYYADIAASLRGQATVYSAGADTALRGLAFLQKTQQSALSSSRVCLKNPANS